MPRYEFNKGPNPRNETPPPPISFEDIFWWSIVSGQPRMVELTWARVSDPLRCAAVGVEACRRIRRRCLSRGRGKVSAKLLLEKILHQLEDGMEGVLDNISKPKVGRTILLERHDKLGCKDGTRPANLLTLGVRFRLRGLVSHELSQGVLDNQWRGCDPTCGCVMLKLDNIRPWELHIRTLLLTMFAWTSVGEFLVTVVPNDAQDAQLMRSRNAQHPFIKRFLNAFSIYHIPCVKHWLALFSSLGRLVVLCQVRFPHDLHNTLQS